jgi:hypothetical protein
MRLGTAIGLLLFPVWWVGTEGCQAIYDGRTVDLSPIFATSLVIEQDYNGAKDLHEFIFSFCDPQNSHFPPNRLACASPGYVLEYQPQSSSLQKCESYFPSQTSPWFYNADKKILGAAFSGSDLAASHNGSLHGEDGGRSATISLSCGCGLLSSPGPVTVTSALLFQFVLHSALLCATPPDCPSAPGSAAAESSAGAVAFVVIFFVGGALYVAGAVGWNFKNGKRGKELAPHPEFWLGLPGLCKDGVLFVVNKVKSLAGKGDGGAGYASV